MQLGFHSEHTSEDYVTAQLWRQASLEHCPLCGLEPGRQFNRHSPYLRKNPEGAWIARYWCRPCHTTFSLMPDCIAARYSSSLDEIEHVVVTVEQASSFEQACFDLRPELRPSGCRRWVRRRVNRVLLFLTLAVTLGVVELSSELKVVELRERLGTDRALAKLRAPVSQWLLNLPTPAGFAPHAEGTWKSPRATQHKVGPDPPR